LESLILGKLNKLLSLTSQSFLFVNVKASLQSPHEEGKSYSRSQYSRCKMA